MPPVDPRQLREIFDEDASLYDTARPGYPDQLVDDLIALGGIKPGDALLEIGCGTGQLTVALARRGFRIICVELGERLASLARHNLEEFPQVAVENAAFETWDPAGRSFRIVMAATAWHWLDKDVRYARAAELLEPGGSLAIITTEHVFPEDGDPFFKEIQDVYEAIGEGDGGGGPQSPDRIADLREDIEAAGLFADIEVRRYVWNWSYTAEEYIAVLSTYSGHRAMEPVVREQLYGEVRRRIAARPDGRVTKHYLNVLHVARRRLVN